MLASSLFVFSHSFSDLDLQVADQSLLQVGSVIAWAHDAKRGDLFVVVLSFVLLQTFWVLSSVSTHWGIFFAFDTFTSDRCSLQDAGRLHEKSDTQCTNP